MALQSLNFAFNMVSDATGIFSLKKRKKWKTQSITFLIQMKFVGLALKTKNYNNLFFLPQNALAVDKEI